MNPDVRTSVRQREPWDMVTRSKLVGVSVLAGLPLLAAILWLVSGREVLTKSGKVVAVSVQDDLFGGVNLEGRFVSGPLFGYYVGLDLVGVVTGAAIIAGLLWWWAARRKRRSAPQAEGGAHGPKTV
jgi:hypothetical protein